MNKVVEDILGGTKSKDSKTKQSQKASDPKQMKQAKTKAYLSSKNYSLKTTWGRGRAGGVVELRPAKMVQISG